MRIKINRKLITKLLFKCFLVVVVFSFFSCKSDETQVKFLFLDENLDVETRVENLIEHMTLEEKVSQMRFDAPAIERLGVPEYNWWNECLHGVARAGKATVFPQAIGMGATWNPSLIFEMGEAVSDEARAKHHRFVKEGKRGIGQGLTFWTPNINIFRDPRWGRGQETYGEDPFLTSRIGVNYIKGLQGDDDKYLKVVATAKHFAVHSGPEKSRHQDNYQASTKDLYETYLPAFKAAVKEAKVYSVMCAYNRFRDVPCCGSDLLLNNILRNDWEFDGYVVSDCWAINDFWQEDNHGVVETPAEAGAMAVINGTDLNCGSVFDPSLSEAVLGELVDEEIIDKALKRLFTARFKLGMFDADEGVKWAKIPYSVVASEEHHELSKKVARESMVLLKNDNSLLPLSKDLKSIAVIGPNANLVQSLLGNYHGTPINSVTPLKGIIEKLPNTKVNYALGCDIASGWATLNHIPSKFLKHGEGLGLKAEYFGNIDFKGEPLVRKIDSTVNFIWTPKRPIKNLESDEFSVRWTGSLIPKESGVYRIGLKASSYGKLFFNDSLRFQYSADYEPKTKYFDVKLEKDKACKIKIEYRNSLSDPQAHLLWSKLDEDLVSPAIKAADASEVVVLCLGLSPEIEGEEMPVVLEGFDKGDRTDLALPQNQIELMKEIKALGKPIVLVLMNGSALAVNWANDNIPAILEAWYPGEFGGNAIADILFGDYNPAGRLPVTFYKSTSDLPNFKDYNMDNRTYRYFKGEPLYPFGYGLSYSKFEYSNLKVVNTIIDGQDINLTVDVKNISKTKGDEVVQLYLSHVDKTENTSEKSLVSFKRVNLSPSETKKVKFKINPEQYRIIGNNGERLLIKNIQIKIGIGGNQVNFNDNEATNTLFKEILIEKVI